MVSDSWPGSSDADAADTLAKQMVPSVTTKAPMRALGAARMLLKRAEDVPNDGFRRAEVPIGFVAITDVEDADLDKTPTDSVDFLNWLEGVAGEPERSSWTSITCSACVSLQTVARESGGVVGAIDDEAGFDDLLRRAAPTSVGLTDTFALSRDPRDVTAVVVSVDGTPETRFTVEAGPVLRFTALAVPPPGAQIEIRYDAAQCP